MWCDNELLSASQTNKRMRRWQQSYNMALTDFWFCSISLKTAAITATLEKPGAHPSDWNRFHPISNFPFISKILERTVAAQVNTRLSDNNLWDSTEKITNDSPFWFSLTRHRLTWHPHGQVSLHWNQNLWPGSDHISLVAHSMFTSRTSDPALLQSAAVFPMSLSLDPCCSLFIFCLLVTFSGNVIFDAEDIQLCLSTLPPTAPSSCWQETKSWF